MTMLPLQAARAAFVAATLVAAPVALAAPLAHSRYEPPERRHGVSEHGVPEFDPAAAGALVALLAGGALYIASRRKSK